MIGSDVVFVIVCAMFFAYLIVDLWWERECDREVARKNADPNDLRKYGKYY